MRIENFLSLVYSIHHLDILALLHLFTCWWKHRITLSDDGVNMVCLTYKKCGASLKLLFSPKLYFPYPFCANGPQQGSVLHKFHHLPTSATCSPSTCILKFSTVCRDCWCQQPLNTSMYADTQCSINRYMSKTHRLSLCSPKFSRHPVWYFIYVHVMGYGVCLAL